VQTLLCLQAELFFDRIGIWRVFFIRLQLCVGELSMKKMSIFFMIAIISMVATSGMYAARITKTPKLKVKLEFVPYFFMTTTPAGESIVINDLGSSIKIGKLKELLAKFWQVNVENLVPLVEEENPDDTVADYLSKGIFRPDKKVYVFIVSSGPLESEEKIIAAEAGQEENEDEVIEPENEPLNEEEVYLEDEL
jgi:hypothetical protein